MFRVLIVEDERRLATLMEKGLKKYGFATAIAVNGEQALALAQTNSFDLLLLDLGLPDQNGLEVLKALQKFNQSLPVIIVSARNDEREITSALREGAQDYITKPFQFTELVGRVHAQLAAS